MNDDDDDVHDSALSLLSSIAFIAMIHLHYCIVLCCPLGRCFVFLLEDKTQQTQAEDLKDKGMYVSYDRQHAA